MRFVPVVRVAVIKEDPMFERKPQPSPRPSFPARPPTPADLEKRLIRIETKLHTLAQALNVNLDAPPVGPGWGEGK